MNQTIASVAMAITVAVAIALPAPASAQAGLDDPDLLAWMHSANAAQRARQEVLAGREDPRSLLMAMYLVHPMFPLREEAQQEIAAEQARAWALLERAAKAGPDDPVVAWKLATCPAESGLAACGSPESRERLAAVAGSYAASQLWLAQVAQAVGDEAAFEARLQAAAEASAYSFEHDIGELIWDAWESIEFPEAGEDIALAYARHMEIDPDAFVEHIVALSVTSRIAAHALPAYDYPLSVCGVSGGGEAIDARRRRQCRAIFTTMANDRPTLLQHLLAGRAMVHLSAGASDAGTWRTRLLSTAWVYETGLELLASLSTRHDPAYFSQWREVGEYRSVLELMERRGIELSPPEGWLPANERMRGLLEEAGPASENDDPGEDPQPE